ncbi:hypothetical protein CDAR_112951 [Caerostris darwini]|uniref:Uncharacterized protein n=1 Tax=Caerostris darwini TaxID=1538125 RepID=A0AAV4Q4J4_9ARAC|nr:hypothetical protein CDAR_112951 [Caerostris darwini]
MGKVPQSRTTHQRERKRTTLACTDHKGTSDKHSQQHTVQSVDLIGGLLSACTDHKGTSDEDTPCEAWSYTQSGISGLLSGILRQVECDMGNKNDPSSLLDVEVRCGQASDTHVMLLSDIAICVLITYRSGERRVLISGA